MNKYIEQLYKYIRRKMHSSLRSEFKTFIVEIMIKSIKTKYLRIIYYYILLKYILNLLMIESSI